MTKSTSRSEMNGADFAKSISPMVRNQLNCTDDRPRFWAAFMAHLTGSMIADIGYEDAQTLHDGIKLVFSDERITSLGTIKNDDQA